MHVDDALFRIGQHLRFDVDGIDDPCLGDGFDETACEVSGTGAKVGDRHSRFHLERLNHLGGFLVTVPFRTVELLQILCDIVRATMLMLILGDQGFSDEKAEED